MGDTVSGTVSHTVGYTANGTAIDAVSHTVSGTAIGAVSGTVRHMTTRLEEFEVTWAVMKRHKPM